MPTYDINGVAVEFPYQAYDCQLRYMEAVITALSKGENALLESPTGTGKTLCLLCAALGWRRHRMQRISEAKVSWEAQADPTAPRVSAGCPRIWYSSRTHSQLKQVIQELKRTTYKPFSVVLGSREQFCVHVSVSRFTGAKQNALCRRARDEKRCPFFDRLKKGKTKDVNTSCCDIEEIVTTCRSAGICPFYKSREDAKEAELMLIPYDYLINPQTRESLEISLKGNVVIFDEGHNIEKSCESVASFELRSADIAWAISEIDDACTALEGSDVTLMGYVLEDMTPDILKRHLNLLKRQLLALEDAILEEHLAPDESTGRSILKAKGTHILEIFQRGSSQGDGISGKDVNRIVTVINKAVAVLTFGTDSSDSSGTYLDKIQSLLVTMFKADPNELNRNYQVLVYEEVEEDKRGPKRKSMDFFDSATTVRSTKTQKKRVLCLWCFSCSVALRELHKQGVHSIVVTSGTLSPIQGTVDSFGVPFPVILENSHVIDSSKQVWGAVLSAGPENHLLDASYQQRNQPGYLRDLGKTIAAFARFVPDGILVAFNSYAQKAAVLNAWRQSQITDEISTFKPMFDEPKNNSEMKEVLRKYSDAIERNAPVGAVLTAVCRGKLTEGIDFTDRQCRLVVMVGIPYPAKNDLRVVLKQSFLDTTGTQGDGRRWYSREAIRAVNQTLGRVIRHKSDFGGVVLCDGRYARDGRLSYIASGISSWLQPRITVPRTFDDALEGCRTFFGVVKDLPTQKAGANAAGARADDANSTSKKAAGSGTANSNTASKNGGGAPLKALGALWKKQQTGGAIKLPVQGAGVSGSSSNLNTSTASNNNNAVATGSSSVAGQNDPAARRAVGQSATPMTGAFRRVNAGGEPQKVPANVAVGQHAGLWLKKAEELVPRMHYESLKEQVAIMQTQAALICDGGRATPGASQGDTDTALMEAMKQTAEILLPEFCFDTPEEKQLRASLVRDCQRLLPRLVWPLWKKRVDEVLSAQGRPGALGV